MVFCSGLNSRSPPKIDSREKPASSGFVGWFGPRGLASLVFALLGLEALGGEADEAVAVIAVTVLLSVVAHGFSAAPLAARYGRAARRTSADEPTHS